MRRAFRFWPGTTMRRRRLRLADAGSHAQDFDFEAAEVGVVVFADAIGNIDAAARLEAKFHGALGEVPADGANGADGRGAAGGPRGRAAGDELEAPFGGAAESCARSSAR